MAALYGRHLSSRTTKIALAGPFLRLTPQKQRHFRDDARFPGWDDPLIK